MSKIAYKIARKITVPLVKLNANEPVAVKFTGDVHKEVQIDSKPDKDGNVKKPATTLRCVSLDTGELVDLIAPMVLMSQLAREYGGIDEELAGKAVLIESTGKRAGKSYNDILLTELAEVEKATAK